MYIIKIFDARGKQINEFELSDFAIITPEGKGMTSNGKPLEEFFMAGEHGFQEPYKEAFDQDNKNNQELENKRKAKLFRVKQHIKNLGVDDQGLPNH